MTFRLAPVLTLIISNNVNFCGALPVIFQERWKCKICIFWKRWYDEMGSAEYDSCPIKNFDAGESNNITLLAM